MNAFAKTLKKLWFATAKIDTENQNSNERIRQVGLVYSIYRIFIGFFLIFTNYAFNARFNDDKHDYLFIVPIIEKTALSFYLIFGLVMLIIIYLYKYRINKLLIVGFVVDMLILSMFLYGGAASELQTVLLFMVVVAASFMLTSLSCAISITLLAILSLVFQQVFYAAANKDSFLNLTDAIMLSISLIAVGFLSWSISQRLAIAETHANKSADEVRRLHAINEQVIQNMVNGVIVVAKSGRILTINHTAKQLLRLDICDNAFESLFEIERIIAHQFPAMHDWYIHDLPKKTFDIHLPASNNALTEKLRVNKKTLTQYGMLLIIEDVSREESHAQQLKLASLGQLTASIAHEVRNPLGAISQATQLLMEDIDDNNAELYQIIYNHTNRVNRIIEDVLRLSRQEPPSQTAINLKKWLPKFLNEHFDKQKIASTFTGNAIIIFDCNHLEQIFLNLINNGLRHTQSIDGLPDIHIDVKENNYEIIIDILDNGTGVCDDDLNNLFNPFFTKSQGGTGLGLYLSRAFSEANHARLRYIANAPKTCFRLICLAYVPL